MYNAAPDELENISKGITSGDKSCGLDKLTFGMNTINNQMSAIS